MTYGPIDILAVEIKGNNFKGEVLESLFDLVERDLINIIDLVVIVKDADGTVGTLELRELDPSIVEVLNPLNAGSTGLISNNDITQIASDLAPNSTAGVLVWENLWAVRAMEAFERLGARRVLFERIPHEIVVEELSDIAALESANG